MSKTNDAFRELTIDELDAVSGGVDLQPLTIQKLMDAPTPGRGKGTIELQDWSFGATNATTR